MKELPSAIIFMFLWKIRKTLKVFSVPKVQSVLKRNQGDNFWFVLQKHPKSENVEERVNMKRMKVQSLQSKKEREMFVSPVIIGISMNACIISNGY